MKTSDFDYNLPEELIAKHPPKNRGNSRLLVINCNKDEPEHRKYSNMVEYFKKGDVLVINNTLVGKRRVKLPGKKYELLFLYPVTQDSKTWKVNIGNIRYFNLGEDIVLKNFKLSFVENKGNVSAKFEQGDPFKFFEAYGEIPIPPYMNRESENSDQDRYNTIFGSNKNSVAAPTASLNMTENLLKSIRQKGVQILEVNLQIGWGTFAPVKSKNMEDHKIHSEYYEMPEDSAKIINKAKNSGKKVWALGTTAARVLESSAVESCKVRAKSEWTNLFITPGYKWKIVDGLITNFHAPKSTLLAMVCAFGGKEKILYNYNIAMGHKYKFLSYGDSCLIY